MNLLQTIAQLKIENNSLTQSLIDADQKAGEFERLATETRKQVAQLTEERDRLRTLVCAGNDAVHELETQLAEARAAHDGLSCQDVERDLDIAIGERDELQHQLDAARAAHQGKDWQPIETCAPIDDVTLILLAVAGATRSWFGTSMSRGQATHWQPLPDPPLALASRPQEPPGNRTSVS